MFFKQDFLRWMGFCLYSNSQWISLSCLYPRFLQDTSKILASATSFGNEFLQVLYPLHEEPLICSEAVFYLLSSSSLFCRTVQIFSHLFSKLKSVSLISHLLYGNSSRPYFIPVSYLRSFFNSSTHFLSSGD